MICWDKIKIFEIRKNALSYLNKDFRGIQSTSKILVFFYYYLIPLIIGLTLIAFEFKIDKDISTYLITGISIFAGLFFNLLIVVSDKMRQRKVLYNSEKDDEKDYAELYKTFSEQLIAYISYAIILSLLLIILMFITQLNLKNFNHLIFSDSIKENLKIARSIFNFFIFYFGYQLLIILSIILSNMYIMLIDDINLEEN